MSGKPNDGGSEGKVRENALRSGRPTAPRGSRWRGAIIIVGFVAAIAAVATTYCMRRTSLQEMKPPDQVSAGH
jgi:hypothetical protein